MAFDYVTLSALTEEFRGKILGTQVEESLRTDEHSLRLRFAGEHYLFICCSPHVQGIFLSSAPVASSTQTPWHSNHLTGAVIQGVEQMALDRVVKLHLEKRSRVGTTRTISLVVELTGRNSNAILVDKESGLIIDALRRVTARMNRFRQILPKLAYVPPPPRNLLNPLTGSFADFKDALHSHSDRTIINALAESVEGMSALAAREVAFNSGIDWEEEAVSLSEKNLSGLWKNTRSLYMRPPGAEAYIIYDEKTSPTDFCVFSPSWVAPEQKFKLSSVSKAVEHFCLRKSEIQKTGQLRQYISHALGKALGSSLNRLEQLRGESTQVQESETLRIKGELLMANLGQIKKGQTEVKLTNLYDPLGQGISISLDPELTPADNARRYFQSHRKLRKAKYIVQQRLAQEEKRAEELEGYSKKADGLADYSDLQALSDELIQKGYLNPPRTTKKGDGEKKKEGFAPRRYYTSKGWTVLVGRNNRENEVLSLRFAAPDDFWFHAQGCPGSHVVLRIEGRKSEPDKITLNEAAALAAYWSKARGSETAPVSYTRAKYVRRCRGASPGTVTISREKTLFVKPRLLPSQEETRS